MQMVQTDNFKPLVALTRAEVRRDGLVIEDGLSPDEWLSGVVEPLKELIGTMEASARWWWGDALAYGERKYGQTYTQALEQSDYSYHSLRLSKMVSERIPLFRRRNNLSWNHHAEIATSVNDAEKREEWLDRASKEGMSTSKLRTEIRRSKGEVNDQPNENAGQFGPVDATMKLRAFFETQDITTWNNEQCRYWLKDLRPIAAAYELLVTKVSA